VDNIGAKVKEVRQRNGLTLKEMSEETGLSTGFLSQFERGITTISVDQLANIANILGVKISYFLSETEIDKLDDPIIRSYDQQVLRIFNQCIYKNLSAEPKNKIMMPKLIEMMPSFDEENIDCYPHNGEEFIYVVEGILTLRLDNKEFQLYPGDSSHYDSSTPHNWANYTNRMVKFIAVHTPNDCHIQKL
jgi:transcriptional regulator with XRE-family HTH domain